MQVALNEFVPRLTWHEESVPAVTRAGYLIKMDAPELNPFNEFRVRV